MHFDTLDQWLEWQMVLHGKVIDLGLERVHEVGERLVVVVFPGLVPLAVVVGDVPFALLSQPGGLGLVERADELVVVSPPW